MMRRIAVLIGLATLGLTVPSAQAKVTIESFSAGTASPYPLAGAHEDATTSFAFAARIDPTTGLPVATGGTPAEIRINLPPGVVGNANATPRCTRLRLAEQLCPAETQVGTGTVTADFGGFAEKFGAVVYNVVPAPREPARFEILLYKAGQFEPIPPVPIVVTASAERNYALTATIPGLSTTAPLLASTVTLWGVPDAHTRGVQNALPADPPAEWKPFMQNTTDCSTVPATAFAVSTYEESEVFTEALASLPIPTDCGHVPFAPSISLAPSPAPEGGTTQVGAPTGLSVDLRLPQSNDPNGRGTAELEKAVVTLPAGMTISPSAASKGLEACTDEQFVAKSDAPATCPLGSVIGEDEVQSPLLPPPGKLTGKVYFGQPLSTNPTSGTMFRVFQELVGFGLDVKLEGSVTADPATGQLTATFADLPELPFQDFKLKFKGGPNAVLVNPPTCGQNATATTLYPYSGTPPATPPSSFTTSLDGNGAPCPASLPFAPSAAILTASGQAGALSSLSVTFTRGDGMQPLGRIDATLPKGLLGYVSKIALCEAPQAVAGTCTAQSRIGTVSTSAGAGSEPLTVQGSVYLAHGNNGYPFMLSVVVPAVAGPYDLGNVVVPVWLQVNSDGSLTALSGPLPSILDGIPLSVRSVTMTVDRPAFALNPTNCGPLSLSGSATSLSGASVALSAPFQVSGCGSLPFKPSFGAATQGSTSRSKGASLAVRITQKPGEAAIRSVHVELPRPLPSRLATLKFACTEAQFAANPAGCPRQSFVGTAKAYTPLLPVPLTGPAVFVSHGGAAFPDLVIVLQGDGITIELTGNTFIGKAGITSSTFATVPDVPISGFLLTLPQGPYSALAANRKLCEQKLLMPTTITGQNGMVIKRSTRIAVSGCAKAKKAKATNAKRAKSSRRKRHGPVPGRASLLSTTHTSR